MINRKKALLSLLALGITTGTSFSQIEVTHLSATETHGPLDSEFENFEDLKLINDSIEPINKVSYTITKPVFDYIGIPLAKSWRWVMPKPIRKSISQFSKNWSYPVRLVSLGLQGEGAKSWQETKHFAVNTTVGVLGLFDPASKKDMPSYNEDLGQAFGSWGVAQGTYIFLPGMGPTSVRAGTGRVGEYFISPTSYVPYLGAFLAFNDISFQIDTYEAFKEGSGSLYEPIRAFWALYRNVEVENYMIPESAFENSDPEPSLGAIWLSKHDRSFINSGKESKARSPATGRKVPYTAWIQDEKAPLVYLIPGIGAHRHSATAIYLAELLYDQGCSVVTVSSPFCPEFIKSGLSSVFPGYTPSDSKDLYQALCAIDAKLEHKYAGRFTDRRLTGYSLGALATGFIADIVEKEETPTIDFSRYSLLNPPFDLRVSVQGFDTYFNAYKKWDKQERPGRIRAIAKNTFLFAQSRSRPGDAMPFDRTESEFMVGLGVRLTFMKAINAGRKRPEYEEDDRDPLSVADLGTMSTYFYAKGFAGPYYKKERGISIEEMTEALSLTYVGETLEKNKAVTIMTNEDDFIIDAAGIQWARETVGDRLSVFPTGGHLGALWDPKVQEQIIKDLVK